MAFYNKKYGKFAKMIKNAVCELLNFKNLLNNTCFMNAGIKIFANE